ncbi:MULTISPECIES: electron transport complex subunit RsxG [unclassified Idiomarina]|jgi:electron transport complex protein RnfG|uniref:electron transport complex subunit RsxG n=2 Tax=Idiomarina TaxID=135575 RepID=UPI0003060155|nr:MULTISPECIES: electron transport complex subunit RsxG [unclassified Idiomarina]NWO03270.1 electron transport complex subunit RsxG [Idiomarinaceae bacterium]|tara:strand:- start:5013 stop:5654 length:642 start_codon:yes stop_codon:yes gene_type:complete
MTLNSMQKNGLLLAAFAVVATSLVIGVQVLTEDKIAMQQQRQVLRTLNQLIPPTMHDNDLYQSCRLLENPALGSSKQQPLYRAWVNEEPTALAAEVIAPDGYSGAIRLLVAIKPSGEVLGVRTLRHQETPGLGDKIEVEKSDWIKSFAEKQVRGADDDRWAVQRDGGMFDQFTGATITPRAVVSAVKRATLELQQQADVLFNADLPHCQEVQE